MKVFLMPQLSDSWWTVRRGVPTSSEFSQIITPARGELSSSANKYIARLIGDIVCQNPAYFTEQGKPINSFAIQNGVDTEPEARRWYAVHRRTAVSEVGFVMDDQLRFGCSPDAMIGLKRESEPSGTFNGHPYYNATAEGACEIKCPLPATQAERLLEGGNMPSDFRPQTHGHLIVCGTEWGEWVSYSSGLAPICVRFVPDAYTEKVKDALEGFWQKFEAAKTKLLT